jgi:hypothetical protein
MCSDLNIKFLLHYNCKLQLPLMLKSAEMTTYTLINNILPAILGIANNLIKS